MGRRGREAQIVVARLGRLVRGGREAQIVVARLGRLVRGRATGWERWGRGGWLQRGCELLDAAWPR